MAFTKSLILWEVEKKEEEDVYEENIFERGSKWMQERQQAMDDYVNGIVDDATSTVKSWFGTKDAEYFGPVQKSTGNYQTLPLDVVMTETHAFSNEVTGYPISTGFQISEHVIRRNPQFSIQGWVTDVTMPKAIVSFNTLGKVAGAMFARDSSSILGSLLGSAGNVVDNLGYKDSSPVKDAYEILKKLVNDGTLVHVATILGTYENCVLRSVNISQNVATSTVLPVQLQFEKMYMISKDAKGNYNNVDYISSELRTKMKEVKNDTTGSYLSDLYGQLTKQGVDISQVLLGVSYNGL